MHRAATARSTIQRNMSAPRPGASSRATIERAIEAELRVRLAVRRALRREAHAFAVGRDVEQADLTGRRRRRARARASLARAYGTFVFTPGQPDAGSVTLGERRRRERITRRELVQRGGDDAVAARDVGEPRARPVVAELGNRQRAETQRGERRNGGNGAPDLLQQSTEREETLAGAAVGFGDRRSPADPRRPARATGVRRTAHPRVRAPAAARSSRDPRGSCAPRSATVWSSSPKLKSTISPCSEACRGRPWR